jgi:hypothetical protein
MLEKGLFWGFSSKKTLINMGLKKAKFLSALIFVFGISGLYAQESTTASGGRAGGAGGSVDFSIGQVGYKSFVGTNGSVALGVEQQYEISVVTGIDIAGIKLRSFVYPNPATDFVKLEIEMQDIREVTYQLSDVQGRLLEVQKAGEMEISIPMNGYKPGIYFLKVLNEGSEMKTFKIIKN